MVDNVISGRRRQRRYVVSLWIVGMGGDWTRERFVGEVEAREREDSLGVLMREACSSANETFNLDCFRGFGFGVVSRVTREELATAPSSSRRASEAFATDRTRLRFGTGVEGEACVVAGLLRLV